MYTTRALDVMGTVGAAAPIDFRKTDFAPTNILEIVFC